MRVKSFAEIRQTLDAAGTLEGLPFMDEMKTFCGQVFLVHRRVDKINDMRHKTGLRRLRGTVTLTAVRCSGAEHGGCQAECQILWKDQWLTRVPAPGAAPVPRRPDVGPSKSADDEPADHVHICQMTRLWEASTPMSRWDVRQDLRPLLLGNVGLGAYVIAMLTRAFNAAQSMRGGTDFPAMPPERGPAPPGSARPPIRGQPVFVRTRADIAATLKNSRTKGLWFDRDMVRFCGQRAVVLKRVERVIHEGTGKMVVMKTPSIVLDEVIATGEFLRLCPQHEYIFWRDAWLEASQSDERAPEALFPPT